MIIPYFYTSHRSYNKQYKYGSINRTGSKNRSDKLLKLINSLANQNLHFTQSEKYPKFTKRIKLRVRLKIRIKIKLAFTKKVEGIFGLIFGLNLIQILGVLIFDSNV